MIVESTSKGLCYDSCLYVRLQLGQLVGKECQQNTTPDVGNTSSRIHIWIY